MELKRQTEENEEGSGNAAEEILHWKKLWEMNIPDKLKVFLWKASHNMLPVGTEISKKVSLIGDERPNYGQIENLKHCLVDCSRVIRIWRNTPIAHLFVLAENVSCGNWLQKVLNIGDDYIDSFVGWNKPPTGVFKMNTDAGMNQKGETGIGCVVRGWNGKVVFAVAKRESVKWPADVAEAKAVCSGLRKATKLNVEPFIVESDCKLESRSDIRDWKFVYKEANSAAHSVAHLK